MHVPSSDTAAAMSSNNRWFRPVHSEFVVYDDARVGIKYLVRAVKEGGVVYGKGKMRQKQSKAYSFNR